MCAFPGGAKVLFPAERLANRFGRGDAEYAWQVYRHHAEQLSASGFQGASSILEIGPGRNLGTSLLWWCNAIGDGRQDAAVTQWDVHPNAKPDGREFWRETAGELLSSRNIGGGTAVMARRALSALENVAAGRTMPQIMYRVCRMDRLEKVVQSHRFDMVYSHAALEHICDIEEFWPLARRLAAANAWCSHRIDLADHGRRHDNYTEMLEWSPLAWWLSMRFVPGAINRWRASDHVAAAETSGIRIIGVRHEERDSLAGERCNLWRGFRNRDDVDLRTTAVDIVGQYSKGQSGPVTG